MNKLIHNFNYALLHLILPLPDYTSPILSKTALHHTELCHYFTFLTAIHHDSTTPHLTIPLQFHTFLDISILCQYNIILYHR